MLFLCYCFNSYCCCCNWLCCCFNVSYFLNGVFLKSIVYATHLVIVLCKYVVVLNVCVVVLMFSYS